MGRNGGTDFDADCSDGWMIVGWSSGRVVEWSNGRVERGDMIKADDYPDGSAEQVLSRFVLAWSKRRWAEMASLCQPTWTSVFTQAENEMRERFGFMRLLDASLEETRPVSDVMKDVVVSVSFRFHSGVAHRRMLARVVCESAPYMPNVAGTWGVNPTSLLREA